MNHRVVGSVATENHSSMGSDATDSRGIAMAISAELQSQIDQVDDLMRALKETKSKEEKDIESLLKTTPAGDLRDMLTERLAEIQQNSSMDVDEAIERVAEIGLSPATIVRLGLSKWKNQTKYNAQKDDSEDDE